MKHIYNFGFNKSLIVLGDFQNNTKSYIISNIECFDDELKINISCSNLFLIKQINSIQCTNIIKSVNMQFIKF